MIHEIWFVVLAFMLAGYAVLDGFDLGVGVLHLFVARTPRERATVIDAIGPVWNGNEVWLLAVGGAMVAAFPRLYATSFSGFYLALMLVLWLLLLRGVGIEFRHQVPSDLWHEAWDVVFAMASGLLALLFGIALGNVLRGVPLAADGQFQGSFAMLLNPFALLCGALSVATLALHGAAYLAMKTEGGLQARARRVVRRAYWVVVALLAAVLAASQAVRPDFTRNFVRWPWLNAFPLLVLLALVLHRRFAASHDTGAFMATGALIGSLLASAAAGMFPVLLSNRPGTGPALDAYNSASPAGSLRIALGVYLSGMVLVVTYMVNVYRVWGGKVRDRVYH